MIFITLAELLLIEKFIARICSFNQDMQKEKVHLNMKNKDSRYKVMINNSNSVFNVKLAKQRFESEHD